MTTKEWILEFLAMYWWPIMVFSIFLKVKIKATFFNKKP